MKIVQLVAEPTIEL